MIGLLFGPCLRAFGYASASRRFGHRYLASSAILRSTPVQGCRLLDVPAPALACSFALLAALASFGAACYGSGARRC